MGGGETVAMVCEDDRILTTVASISRRMTTARCSRVVAIVRVPAAAATRRRTNLRYPESC